MVVARSSQPIRREGSVRFYSSEEGRGYIHADNQDYRFTLTDVIGTVAPLLGDSVLFTPQLKSEHLLARLVVLASNPQFVDFDRPSAEYRPVALDIKLPSAEVARRRQTGTGPRRDNNRGPEHIQCQECRRLVVPKFARVRPLLLGKGRRGGWKIFCPRCKASQDGARPARSLVISSLAVSAFGLYWFGRQLLF